VNAMTYLNQNKKPWIPPPPFPGDPSDESDDIPPGPELPTLGQDQTLVETGNAALNPTLSANIGTQPQAPVTPAPDGQDPNVPSQFANPQLNPSVAAPNPANAVTPAQIGPPPVPDTPASGSAPQPPVDLSVAPQFGKQSPPPVPPVAPAGPAPSAQPSSQMRKFGSDVPQRFNAPPPVPPMSANDRYQQDLQRGAPKVPWWRTALAIPIGLAGQQNLANEVMRPGYQGRMAGEAAAAQNEDKQLALQSVMENRRQQSEDRQARILATMEVHYPGIQAVSATQPTPDGYQDVPAPVGLAPGQKLIYNPHAGNIVITPEQATTLGVPEAAGMEIPRAKFADLLEKRLTAGKPAKADIHAEYSEAVADAMKRGVDPAQDPKVQQYAAAITALQKQATEKEPSRDDKAIAIQSKPPAQRTPEENAFLTGYHAWVKENKTDPGVIRMEALGNTREIPVINTDTKQLEFRSASDINEANKIKPGLYAPANPATAAMSKGAVFQDLHYNIDAARNAVGALATLDAGTRAALADQLKETDPKSAVSTFLRGAVGSQLSREQQHAVQALAQLNENAMSLRSVAGMGQGAQDLRDAIRGVLPSAKSASKEYMQEQLNNFENVVNRLETGVPGVGKPGAGATVAPTRPKGVPADAVWNPSTKLWEAK